MSLAPASVLGMIHLVKILSLKRENQVKQGAAQSCLPVRNKSLDQSSLSSQVQESSSTKPTRGLHMTLPDRALGGDKMVVVVVVLMIAMVVMWWCGHGGDGGGDDDGGSDDNNIPPEMLKTSQCTIFSGSSTVLANQWDQKAS